MVTKTDKNIKFSLVLGIFVKSYQSSNRHTSLYFTLFFIRGCSVFRIIFGHVCQAWIILCGPCKWGPFQCGLMSSIKTLIPWWVPSYTCLRMGYARASESEIIAWVLIFHIEVSIRKSSFMGLFHDSFYVMRFKFWHVYLKNQSLKKWWPSGSLCCCFLSSFVS